MCGIVGYTGGREAAPFLLSGLRALEYRGYDSAGLAVMGEAGLEDRRGKRKKDQVPRTKLEKAQTEIEQLKHKLYLAEMENTLLKKLDEIERREAFRK